MIIPARAFDFEQAVPFDTAVVGSGAVGMPVALRLARSGRRVVLIEAGPEKPSHNSQAFFESAVAVGHELPGLHLGRFRNLGGTTAFWGGQLVPFAPMVFRKRDWVTDATWPITAAELAPYYAETLDMLGMGHAIVSDAEVWRTLKVEPPPATRTVQPFFTRWIREPNYAVAFDHELRQSKNLTVIIGAPVGAISCGPDGQVEAVEVRLEDGTRRLVRADTFVLANGTVEISRLLQMPGHEGRKTPWSDNAWVGRAFIDHVDCYAGSVVPIDNRRFSDLFDNAFIAGLKYNPKLRLSDEVQAEEKLLEISAHFVFNHAMKENIANLKIVLRGLMNGHFSHAARIDPISILRSLKFIVPMAARYLRHRRMMNFRDGGIQLRLTSEQRPQADSRIALTDRVNSFGMPEVDVDWRIAPADIASIARYAEFVKTYLEENGLARVTLDPGLATRDPSFIYKADDANHQMGGARMASDAADGVVDADCRVFGTTNLYVAGAAVYPSSGFANPTFTAMALGLRIADRLLGSSSDGKVQDADFV